MPISQILLKLDALKNDYHRSSDSPFRDLSNGDIFVKGFRLKSSTTPFFFKIFVRYEYSSTLKIISKQSLKAFSIFR